MFLWKKEKKDPKIQKVEGNKVDTRKVAGQENCFLKNYFTLTKKNVKIEWKFY